MTGLGRRMVAAALLPEKRLEKEQLQALQDDVEYCDPVLWSLWAPWPWF